MQVLVRARALTTALSIFLAAAATGMPAFADQVVQTTTPPVVVIHSTSGLVSVMRGDIGSVRVSGAATATTFEMTSDDQGIMLPGGMGFPARRLKLPGVRQGTMGVRVDNPGGDVTVYVPQRVGAVLVKLDDGDAALSQFRGPYVVVTNGGSVDLRGLSGFGHVRTTTGRVTMARVGGNLHVETTLGSVEGDGMMTERADIRTQGGDIDWSFARVAGGPYRFTSGGGNVRVALNGDAAANIDAQSRQGSVVNRFPRSAAIRFRSPHAMSMSVRGGGPQITAASGSGIVEIGPRHM